MQGPKLDHLGIIPFEAWGLEKPLKRQLVVGVGGGVMGTPMNAFALSRQGKIAPNKTLKAQPPLIAVNLQVALFFPPDPPPDSWTNEGPNRESQAPLGAPFSKTQPPANQNKRLLPPSQSFLGCISFYNPYRGVNYRQLLSLDPDIDRIRPPHYWLGESAQWSVRRNLPERTWQTGTFKNEFDGVVPEIHPSRGIPANYLARPSYIGYKPQWNVLAGLRGSRQILRGCRTLGWPPGRPWAIPEWPAPRTSMPARAAPSNACAGRKELKKMGTQAIAGIRSEHSPRGPRIRVDFPFPIFRVIRKPRRQSGDGFRTVLSGHAFFLEGFGKKSFVSENPWSLGM